MRLSPEGAVSYFVLADRLVLASRGALLARALEASIGERPAAPGAPVPFAGLEESARGHLFAAAFQPGEAGPEAASAPLGLRSIGAIDGTLSAELDLGAWGESAAPTLLPPGGIVRLEGPGLDGAAAWRSIRPAPEPEGAALLGALDALAQRLGRGAGLWLGADGAGGLGGVLAWRTSSEAAEPLERAARLAFVEAEEPFEAALRGGRILCPGGVDASVCVCSRAGWSAVAVAEHAARPLLERAEEKGEVGGPVLLRALADGAGLRLEAELRGQGGGARGSWTLASAPAPTEAARAAPKPASVPSGGTAAAEAGAGAEAAVQLSVDAPVLPGAEGQPVAHLAVRGAREVELTLYRLPNPLAALAGRLDSGAAVAPPPLESAARLGGRALSSSYRAIWRALTSPGRALARALSGASRPLGASLPRDAEQPSEVRGDEPLVRAWRVEAPEPGWTYADVALGPLEAGAYRAVALAGGARGEAIVLSSRLALLVARAGGGVSLLATDAHSGAPREGAEIFVSEGEGRELSLAGRTQPNGLLVARAPMEGIAVARLGADLAWAPLPPAREERDLVPPSAPRVAAALTLDRSRYLAGETLHARALLRVRTGPGAPLPWRIADAQEATLELRGRRGTLLESLPVDISALGTVDASLPLPEGLPPGLYSAVLDWGRSRRGVDFELASGAPPELSGRWELPRMEPGRPVVARLRVRQRPGLPLPGAAVRWDALWRSLGTAGDGVGPAEDGPWESLAIGSGVSGAGGELTASLPSPPGPGRVRIEARLEDPAGREARAVAEAEAWGVAPRLRISPEHRIARPGKAIAVGVEAASAGGEPWRGEVELLVRFVRAGPSGEAQKSESASLRAQTDAKGRATLLLPPAAPGYVELEARPARSGRGEAGFRAQASIFVTEAGGDVPTTPDRLLLVPDKIAAAPGDELRFLLLCPFESGVALVGVAPGGPPDHVVPIHGYSGIGRVRLGELPALLSASALVAGRSYRALASIAAAERGEPLSLRIGPDRLKAGAGNPLSIEVRDAAGRGVPAWLGLFLSNERPWAPRLEELLAPLRAPPGVAFSREPFQRVASGEASRPPLQPYGPVALRPEAEGAAPDGHAISLTADDSGAAVATIRPQQGGTLHASLWAVEGPGLFAERRIDLRVSPPAEPPPELPAWMRPGDRLVAAAAAAIGPPQALCPAPPAVAGGRLVSFRCEGATAISLVEAGPPGLLELRGAHRTARLPILPAEDWAAGLGRSPRAAARELAERLASAHDARGDADLACAAVRALGALGPAERSARSVEAALARLAQLENLAGGFGSAVDERRRDCEALAGLGALAGSGATLDRGLVDRTRQRIEDLRPGEGGPVAGLPRGCSEFVKEPSRRPGRLERTAIVERSSRWLRGGDPLDAAEAVVALAPLSGELPPDWAPPATSVRRSLSRLTRPPWTEAAIAADDEPPEATKGPGLRLRVGDELQVELSAELAEATPRACLVERPAAGLLPMGLPEEAAGAFALCGDGSSGRLVVSYGARAVHAGEFALPGASLGFAAASLPAGRLEVSP